MRSTPERRDEPDAPPSPHRAVKALRAGHGVMAVGGAARCASAVGALPIGALAIGRARIRHPRIDASKIGRIRLGARERAR